MLGGRELDLKNDLTTAEISHLWNSYVFDTLVHNLLSYFLNNVEDEEIKKFASYVYNDTQKNMSEYVKVFTNYDLPVPRGTILEDVNSNSPRLFSDKFYIVYGESMTKFALSNFTLAYVESSRDDIRRLFRNRLDGLEEVNQYAVNLLISKGYYTKPPILDIRSNVEFIEDKDFFAGYFGEKRHLSTFEVKQLFFNYMNNCIGKALMLGFSKVASSNNIKEYFIKGAEMADKYMKLFSDKLGKEFINEPFSLESEVLDYSDSNPPLSDRIMLNHTVFLNSYGIGNYGLSLALSQRRDLTAMYGKIVVDVGLYADKGADLLIENKWLEQPPLPAFNGE